MGIAIAHALAFQLILTATLATQMAFAASGDQAICHSISTDSSTDDTQPAKSASHHEACRICAFAACSPAIAVQHQSLVIWPSRSTLLFANAWPHKTPSRGHEPRSSQGPPPLV